MLDVLSKNKAFTRPTLIHIKQMQFSHNSSSLFVDSRTDFIYGKFFPSQRIDVQENREVKIFTEVYGIFGNLTKRLADKLDNFVILPTQNCVIKENYLLDYFPLEALVSMTEEPEFWSQVEKYTWFPLILEKLYKTSNGQFYLFMDWDYKEQLSDRRIWCERMFGNTIADNLILTTDKNRPLLVKERQDLLIDCDLSNIEAWCKAGGSGFYFPELNYTNRSEDIVKILARRFSMLSEVVKYLNAPIVNTSWISGI